MAINEAYAPTIKQDGTVTSAGKTIGSVRPAGHMDTVNMAGRSWVAVRRGGAGKVAGTFSTRKQAAEALVKSFYGTRATA